MKIISLSILIILLSSLGCGELYCECESNDIINQLNDSIIKEALSIEDNVIANTWEAYDEQNLVTQNREYYRFLYTAPFGEFQKIYTIMEQDSSASLSVKRFTSSIDSLYSVNKNVVKKSSLLSKVEWESLKKIIAENCFWNLLANDNQRGLDGSNWLLEGFNPSNNSCQKENYHFVYRWSPDSSSQSFLNICNKMKEMGESIEDQNKKTNQNGL